MPRSQGKPIAKDEIQRIQMLLADTDLTMTLIAERMNCTRSSIIKINKKFQIRSYNGQRSSWQAGEGVNTSAQRSRSRPPDFCQERVFGLIRAGDDLTLGSGSKTAG